jgi:hypothetical protein
VLAFLAAIALVTSTGGYSSVTAGRDVQVAVAPDHAAFLGYEQTRGPVTHGSTNVTVTVTNQFPSGTSLDRVVVCVPGECEYLTADGPLRPGENVTVRFEYLPCHSTIWVAAAGSGVSVRLSRPVTCGG